MNRHPFCGRLEPSKQGDAVMLMEMPLVGLKPVRYEVERTCDVVTLDRDAADAIHLRFLVRNQTGKWMSREITLEADVAEELRIMLDRELAI